GARARIAAMREAGAASARACAMHPGSGMGMSPIATNILVPTDFSEIAERVLDYAVALAAKLDARIHVVHVIGIPALGIPEIGLAVTSTMMDSMVRGNQAALDRLVDKRRGQATFGEVMLRTGDARDTILATAEEVGADLIVMGTHGR